MILFIHIQLYGQVLQKLLQKFANLVFMVMVNKQPLSIKMLPQEGVLPIVA